MKSPLQNQRGATVKVLNVVVILKKRACNDHLLPLVVLRWKWMSICILKVRIFTCFLIILFFTYMVPVHEMFYLVIWQCSLTLLDFFFLSKTVLWPWCRILSTLSVFGVTKTFVWSAYRYIIYWVRFPNIEV